MKTPAVNTDIMYSREMQRSQVRDFGRGFVHHLMAKLLVPPCLLLFVPSVFSRGYGRK